MSPEYEPEDENEYTVNAMIGKSKYAVSMYFEKLDTDPLNPDKVIVKRHLITHTCEAANEKEALGDAIWQHNYSPDNGTLKLWQVALFGSDLLHDQVLDEYRREGKLWAIKKYRLMTGTSLKEGKRYVDDLQVRYQLDHNGKPIEMKTPCFPDGPEFINESEI